MPIDGTPGDDTLNGTPGDDTINGLDGNDTLDGAGGNDVLDGGNGSDTASFASWTEGVFAGLGNTGNGFAENASGTEFDQLLSIENLSGTAFNDQLNGNDSNNVLTGGEGHDLLFGRGGSDTMIGGNGDDFLRGSEGADIMDGGAGWDRVSSFVPAPTGGITFNLNIQGVAQDTGQGMDILIGIEHASGTVLNDTLTGNGGDNWLWDGADGDATVAASGDDTISAGGGNDLVEVGNGNDTLDGGTGSDTWSFLGGNTEISSAGVTASLALQGAAQDTEQGMMAATGFENLSGSIHDDNLTGDGNDNVLAGDTGNDNLSGGAGSDTLYGDGRIHVDNHGTGGSGPITTWADVTSLDPGLVDGDDVLDGGAGDDLLYGGGGNDTASFASATEGVFAGLGNTGNGFADNASGTEFDQLFSIENLSGSAFNDQLNGNDSANVLTGGDGHDLLFGRGGSDTMIGGNGDDFLRGSDGADIMDGGAGWDRVSSFVPEPTAGISFNLNIQGVAQDTGQGMDTLIGIEHASGTVLDDTLTGNGGDNWLWDGSDGDATVASSGSDVISAGAGNDLVEVGAGNDTLDGGTGTDTWSLLGGQSEIGSAGVTASLALQGAAQDTEQGMMTAVGFENLSGSLHADNLTGDANANVLAGDLGSDNLSGGAGDDTLYGDGRISVDNHGTGGSGPITTFANADDVDRDGDGTPDFVSGNDTLEGGAGNDHIDGGVGSDTASYAGNSGPVEVSLQFGFADEYSADESEILSTDTLVSIENATGSAFGDVLVGDGDANVLSGGGGNDQIRGLGGDDTLNGDGGHDFMRGGDGDDVMSGGEDDDYLAGDLGDDYLDGGNGFDRVSYAVGATTGVTVSLAILTAQATGMGTDTIVGVEHLTGTRFDDTLTGNSGDNWIWGGSDATGVTGNDVINAGDGNDLVEVGTGNHTLSGGNGNDTLSLFGNSSDITAAGITFDLTLQGAAQNTEQGLMTATGFENVSGSIFADFIYGDSGANVLLGDVGNDTLRGGDGNDRLYGDGRLLVDDHGTGGSGPITLFNDADPTAAGGNDTLLGGRGDDWLYGGRGDDTLTGNQGNDRYVVEASSGDDRITDFAPNVDTILFDPSSGVDSFGDLTLTKVGNSTVITWGTGDSLTLEGVKPNQLDSGDFEFSSSPLAAGQLVAKDAIEGPTYDHSAVAEALSSGSTFGGHEPSFAAHAAFGGDAFDHAAAALAMQGHV